MRRIFIAALIVCGTATPFLYFSVSEKQSTKRYVWEVRMIGTDASTQEPVSDVRVRTASTEYYVGELPGQCSTLESRNLLASEISGIICESSVGSVEIGIFRSEAGTSVQALNRSGSNGAIRDLFTSKVILVLNRNDWEE